MTISCRWFGFFFLSSWIGLLVFKSFIVILWIEFMSLIFFYCYWQLSQFSSNLGHFSWMLVFWVEFWSFFVEFSSFLSRMLVILDEFWSFFRWILVILEKFLVIFRWILVISSCIFCDFFVEFPPCWLNFCQFSLNFGVYSRICTNF